jgi:hypothetical protein
MVACFGCVVFLFCWFLHRIHLHSNLVQTRILLKNLNLIDGNGGKIQVEYRYSD